jgi:hypothetical protein
MRLLNGACEDELRSPAVAVRTESPALAARDDAGTCTSRGRKTMKIEAICRMPCALAVLAAVLGAVPTRAQWVDDEPGAKPQRQSQSQPSSKPAGGRPVGVLLRMGLDVGGDKLAEVQYANGDTAQLTAGGLVTFAAGVLIHPAAPWALEATVGYKIDKVNASNGTLQFSRIPVDVILSYANSGHRLGAGATVHLSPTGKCEVDGYCNESVSYNHALGGIVQYVYGWGRDRGVELGVRGTFIHYSGDGLKTINGSSVGLILGGWL